MVGYLGEFIPDLATPPPLAAGAAIAAIVLLTAINASGVREASLVQALVAMFTAMILLSTLASLIPFVFSAMADLHLTLKEKRPGAGLGVVLTLVAFTYAMVAIAGAGQGTVFWGFLAFLGGIPFFVLTVWRGRGASQALGAGKDPGRPAPP